MRRFSMAAIMMLVAASALAQVSRFSGVWKDTGTSGGIVRLEVTGSPDALQLQAWGACTPDPCDWGRVRAWAYSDAAGTPITEATAISATFTTSFAERIVILSLRDMRRMRVDTYTRFTDTSGRASYHTTDYFMRSQ